MKRSEVASVMKQKKMLERELNKVSVVSLKRLTIRSIVFLTSGANFRLSGALGLLSLLATGRKVETIGSHDESNVEKPLSQRRRNGRFDINQQGPAGAYPSVNKAGYTAQDAPSTRLKITGDGRTEGHTLL